MHEPTALNANEEETINYVEDEQFLKLLLLFQLVIMAQLRLPHT